MKKLRFGSKMRRALRGSSRGLTLVEVVIAMALMAIIGVAFLGGLSNAMFSLHIADVRTTAESLARSEMEYVKSQNYENAPWGPVEEPAPGYDGYMVRVSGEPLDETDQGIQEITVVVIHHDRGEVITLVGYKTDRL